MDGVKLHAMRSSDIRRMKKGMRVNVGSREYVLVDYVERNTRGVRVSRDVDTR